MQKHRRSALWAILTLTSLYCTEDQTGRADVSRFNIIDVVMVSAMGPPGGGRTFITERTLDASKRVARVTVRIGERSSDVA